MTFKSVLVALDVLAASPAALEEAVEIAKLSRGTVTLVTVISLPAPGLGIPVPVGVWMPLPMGESDAAQLESAKKRLNAFRERLLAEGLSDVETVLLEGDPVDRVAEYADTHRPDLIVVGSRGLSTAGRFFLGSVSDGVLHHAHCSVLVVKPRAEAPIPT